MRRGYSEGESPVPWLIWLVHIHITKITSKIQSKASRKSEKSKFIFNFVFACCSYFSLCMINPFVTFLLRFC